MSKQRRQSKSGFDALGETCTTLGRREEVRAPTAEPERSKRRPLTTPKNKHHSRSEQLLDHLSVNLGVLRDLLHFEGGLVVDHNVEPALH